MFAIHSEANMNICIKFHCQLFTQIGRLINRQSTARLKWTKPGPWDSLWIVLWGPWTPILSTVVSRSTDSLRELSLVLDAGGRKVINQLLLTLHAEWFLRVKLKVISRHFGYNLKQIINWFLAILEPNNQTYLQAVISYIYSITAHRFLVTFPFTYPDV